MYYIFSNYYNAFAFALLHPVYGVRKRAQDVLRKLLRRGAADLVIALLKSIGIWLDTTATAPAPPNAPTAVAEWPSAKALCESLLILTSVKNLTLAEIETIALESLPLANNALAKRVDIDLYEKCLNKLVDENKANNAGLTLNRLIESQSATFFQLLTTGPTLNDVSFFFSWKIEKKFIEKN